jgi:polyisoprenyl-teichoic acid--peptidoglycan teichoic acid transferase
MTQSNKPSRSDNNAPKRLTWLRSFYRSVKARSIFAATFFALILCLLGSGSFIVVRQLMLTLGGNGNLLNPSFNGITKTPITNEEGTPLPGNQLPGNNSPIVQTTLTPWDGAGRVTALLLGLDYRDWEASEGASRSDTMILLTLDPQTKTAGILSIPRDLWVAIPGFQHGKINTAYYLGDAYKLPGGGPALAVKTVENFLGVPINYYAQIDFEAFVQFIDEIGGVKINVPQEITIDLLGTGFKTKKKLKAGVQVLPGEWALAYARNRYTEGGDFDRAGRQQEVIMAIRNQILSLDILPTLISKAPTLYSELSSGIHTNLTLDELIKLALLAQTVPEENIQKAIINKDNVFFGFSPDGLSILIPIPDDIHLLRDQIFASSGSISPQTPGNSQEQMKTEGAKIAIFNGSNSPDLGSRTGDYLRNQGANIIQIGNANQAYAATTIVDHTGNPFALKYLVELMKIPNGKISIQFDPNSSYDIELFLGNDWESKNTLP